MASGNKLQPYVVSPNGSSLTNVVSTVIFTVEKDANGNLLFVNEGKYLTTGATGNSLTLAEASGDYSLWTAVVGPGGYFLKSTNAKYNNNPQ